MAYLSNRDFYKEFGENILISPFISENIKSASINLTASDYAWDLNTKKRLLLDTTGGKNKLIIPPFATIAIMTEEVIYVGKSICGTYHSKVGMTIQGFGNISTTLDPEYIGTSLICSRNNTPVQQEIYIGNAFVTLMLSYVSQPALYEMTDRQNMPGQRERVSGFENGYLFIEKQRNDGFHDNPQKLKEKMLDDRVFKQWKENFFQKDIEKQNEVRSLSKKIATIKIIIYFIAYMLIATAVWLTIKKIETPDLEYLKSYVALIVVVLGFGMNGLNFCLKKLMIFIEDKYRLRHMENK